MLGPRAILSSASAVLHGVSGNQIINGWKLQPLVFDDHDSNSVHRKAYSCIGGTSVGSVRIIPTTSGSDCNSNFKTNKQTKHWRLLFRPLPLSNPSICMTGVNEKCVHLLRNMLSYLPAALNDGKSGYVHMRPLNQFERRHFHYGPLDSKVHK